jgi:predicted MPP superfamily phosphohydrolase
VSKLPVFSRRHFLKGALAVTAGGTSTLGYACVVEPHWVEVVRRDLPIAQLPAPLVGHTLVQITDIHVGRRVSDAYLLDTLARVNDLGADILVLTGDYMTCDRDEEVDHAARILSHLRPARLATVGVLGNHDYGYGSRYMQRTADKLVKQLAGHGIDILSNGTRTVEGLTIAGLDDMWGPRFHPRPVLASLDPRRANLVLCHNPDVADVPVWGGYRGWILCGHTHGGQCRLPFLGPPVLPVNNPRYVAGEVDLHDGRRLYINRGIGHLLQARFNVRPEITVFTMQRA